MEWNLWERCLEVIYPPRCPFCNEVRPIGGKKICENCLRELPRLSPPYCFKCGKPVTQEEEEYCKNCKHSMPAFDRAYPVLLYRGKVKKALMRFKYKNDRQIGSTMVRELGGETLLKLKKLPIDGIVPVPMHRKKEKERGYNQAYLLAKEVGAILELPVYKDYLVRSIRTTAQKDLEGIRERKKNIKKAFKIGKNVVKLKHILLVDDIYTTGATASACARVLKNAGAVKVYVFCIGTGTDVI